jgi:hypothetical protein
MFPRLISFLTAVTFAAHGLWGCCWRDAHDCAPTPTIDCHELSLPVDCCQHGHHDSDEPGAPHDGPCKLHCRGVCVYVSPVKSQVEAPQIDIRLDFAAAAFLRADEHYVVAADARNGTADAYGFQPPARLHVLHQVFLI